MASLDNVLKSKDIDLPAKAEHCHLAYLTYMQNTSSEMPDRMKHKLDSRLQGKLSMTSDMQVTPPLGQKAKGS